MNHKYGFHVNQTGGSKGNEVLDAVRRIRPKVVKVLDPDVDFCKKVRDLVPDVFLIGRVVLEPSEQDRFALAPAETGRKFAERMLNHQASKAQHNGKLLLNAWESYNEVLDFGNASGDRKRQYDEFQVAFARPIQQAGFEPIAMNFGTGNGLGDEFLEYFAGTLETHRYLGFHEYDWPTMWRMHEENIVQKNEDGMWLCLRYRRTMNVVRQRYPGRHTVLMTECGLAQGVQGRDDVGWLHEPAVSEDSYWDSLMWYNHEIMKDDFVLGACLFVVGAAGGWPKWESFEHLGGLINRLEAFAKGTMPPPTIHPVPSPRRS